MTWRGPRHYSESPGRLHPDLCRCSWRIHPELPEDQRYMLGDLQCAGLDFNEALANFAGVAIQATQLDRAAQWLNNKLTR
jgi:hypothetical protein